MPLTDQGRKLLWGQAGGRCAICQRLLTADEADPEPAVVVGEECHIVSPRAGGPRYRPLAPADVDAYDNLVLLCPSDHETVDKQPLHFTEERLLEIKRTHEAWVRRLPGLPRIRVRRDRSPEAELVRLVVSGRELMLGAGGAHAAEVVTPEVADEAEAELVGGFVQGFQDWAELWNEIPMTSRLKAELDLTDAIRDLRDAGFVVYCGHRHDTLEGGIGSPTTWHVTTLCIFRSDDPQIQVTGDDETAAD